MKIILQDRQSGKTFRLILESAETKAVIVVAHIRDISHILHDARKHNLDIPNPITWEDYLRLQGKNPNTNYLIDNLDLILGNYFNNVQTITLSNPWHEKQMVPIFKQDFKNYCQHLEKTRLLPFNFL